MANSITDWRGNKIEIGDTILYAVKHSTSVEVNEAIVKAFGVQPEYSYHEGPTIIADWIRSTDGEWAQKWRKVRTVILSNTKGVTLIAKVR